jgi:hypothetical protein
MSGVQLGIRLIGDSFHKHPAVSETQCDTPEFAVFRNVLLAIAITCFW